MKQFILLTLISTFLFSYEFKLNQKDINFINNSKKKTFIVNRLDKYLTIKNEVKDYDLIRKLSHINSFLNKIFPASDISNHSSVDYWATPKEFLLEGHGDCEDYAIAKYFTLLEVGIKKENLYFAIVDKKGAKNSHMVLLYIEDKKSSPLVLDNLSSKVVPLNKRLDLIPKFAFNEIDSYKLDYVQFTQKVRINWGKDNKWEKLLNRVYNLNE